MAANFTKSEVAQIIEQFLDGTGGPWDWDDFTSIRIADPELEAIRVRCVQLGDSRSSGEYCGSEGLAEMRRMVEELRCDPGYRIIDNVLSDVEISELLRSLETSQLRRGRAGVRHLMAHRDVQALAHGPRLLAIAVEFLGTSAIPYRATLFDKSPERNWLVTWHQDTALPLEERRDAAGWGPWSVKCGITYAHAPARALCRVVALRLHFDDSGSDNGPLRVLPGTHRLGVLPDAAIDQIVDNTSAVDCLVAAGGIVAMRPLILHASSKAESTRPRRVLHIEYVDSLDIDDGLRIAIA